MIDFFNEFCPEALESLCESFAELDLSESSPLDPTTLFATTAVVAISFTSMYLLSKCRKTSPVSLPNQATSSHASTFVASPAVHGDLFDILIAAIKSKNTEVAISLISQMTTEQLNLTDFFGKTPLYHALQKSQAITKAIVNKFLEEKQPLNTQSHKGSIFNNIRLGKRLLGIVNERYKDYACSDAIRFPGNIHPKADRESIIARKSKDPRSETEATTIQPFTGRYSRASIARAAQLIDKAQSGACTTLALAALDKFLILFPNERFEIISHESNFRGTHVFIAMNHHGEGWSLDELNFALRSKTLPAEELEALTQSVAQQYQNTFIIDPWLASLGWDKGIFDIAEYATTDAISHFMTNGKCYFDSQNTSASSSLRLV